MRKLCLLFLSVILVVCSASAQHIDARETDQGVLFFENGDNILFYQRVPKSFDGQYTRNDYVHPLWSMDGDTLTEDYPPDHAHHRGIFWTWHQIYVGDTRLGDAWECRDFVWDVVDVQVGDAENGGKMLTAEVLYKSPKYVDADGEMIAAVQEQTRITVHPAAEEYRAVDFEISLLALQDGVSIGGSEDRKGYGGFSARIKMPEDLRFVSRTGDVQPKTTAVAAGPWMDMVASFDGVKESGVTILQHPSNPQPLNTWILRRKGSMQNPVYPGRERVPISKTKPTLLKYRLIVHRGGEGAVNVQALFKDYIKSVK